MDATAAPSVDLARPASIAARGRILLVRFLITAVTLGLVFVGLELLFDKFYSEGQSQTWSRFHSVRGWSLAPGDYSYKPPRDLHRVAIHINSLGLRSREGEEKPKAGSIMILGDSFVFARETDIGETFPQRLENLVNQRIGGDIKVLNAGMPGYGTGQELLLVREMAEKYHVRSNIYVVMFFTNDTLDNLCLSYGDLKFQPVRPCFSMDGAGKAVLSRLPDDIPDYEDDALAPARRSQFGLRTASIARAWAEERLQTAGSLIGFLSRFGITPSVGRVPGVLNAWYQKQVVRDGIPLTAALIAQMKGEIEQQGGQLLVSMVPSAFQMYPETYIPILQHSFPGDAMVGEFASDTSRPQKFVGEMCQKAGVPFLDLLPILAKHRETPLFIARDGHLTRAGHKLASEALLPFVLEHMPKQAQSSAVSNTGSLQ